MKQILFFVFSSLNIISHAQYIGVRARYTETRLVDDAPNPPKRENRLILSFYEVSPTGVYTPTVLGDYDIWIYKEGIQYGNVMGGVLDSTGNNYPGYSFTAPQVVAYSNTLGLNYIECNSIIATKYTVNGHELDCGFITVSYWDIDYGTMIPYEAFPAPNVCLTLYPIEHPYYYLPGNLNFSSATVFPGPPYNLFNFNCGGGTERVVRGILPADTGGSSVTLTVRFANVRGELQESNAFIEWSNLTESDVASYVIEVSVSGNAWQAIGTVLPVRNDGSRADYQFTTLQTVNEAYYRIRAVELNGSNFYSAIVLLRRRPATPNVLASPVLSVYPNPVTGTEFSYRLTNAQAGRYIATIITADGRRIKQQMVMHSIGDIVRQVDANDLMPGLYQLVLHGETGRYAASFFIWR